jgi:transcriptional regulator with XRE-family HTH domain
MSSRNLLLETPPYRVEKTLRRLGSNLKIARLRRNLTIQQVSQRIGTGIRAVSDAEKGKPSTGVAIYVALLWAYDLLGQMNGLADPATDEEGLALSLRQARIRARPGSQGMDNNF